MQEYRGLSECEIEVLQKQGCCAENWNTIRVHPAFRPEHISCVRFSGEIKLGVFEEVFIFPGGYKQHSGIRNAALHNCCVGDHACIENVRHYIANFDIGERVCIQNIDSLCVDGVSDFGNGVEALVLNEAGGREVMINNKLNAHFAYIMSLYRHRPVLIRKMREMVSLYAKEQASDRGYVGSHAGIRNAGTIKNVCIGAYATIDGASHLENGTINSNVYDPVFVGRNVTAKDFIISSGSRVDDGTMLTRCFVGQGCQLNHGYSASDSLFFSNCHGENGEACAIFAGPYTVTHHKSTLLIAGMFSFMNAGSGSNQSNHMYKLGPIHQGIIERGGKTGSNSYLFWPARIGAFSLVMGSHYHHPDTSDMPFSYLLEEEGGSVLLPGVNLRTVGTIRDAQKFPRRDKRKDPERLDQLNFNLFTPYTVQKMFRATELLDELLLTGDTSGDYVYQNCRIPPAAARKGRELYHMGICKFLGNALISRLQQASFSNEKELRDALRPDSEIGRGDWADLAGLLVPRMEIEHLMTAVETGKITRINEVNAVFEEWHRNYASYAWTWAWDKIPSYCGVNPDAIGVKEIVHILSDWKDAVTGLDRMIYEDAKKEFSFAFRTGFGVDGDENEQQEDFEQVRGKFEENAFVKSVLEHIKQKTGLWDAVIADLQKIEGK